LTCARDWGKKDDAAQAGREFLAMFFMVGNTGTTNDKTIEKTSKMCSETYFLVSGKREKCIFLAFFHRFGLVVSF